MIIIFSNNQDYSTFDIIEWLHYLGYKDVLRVNSKDFGNTLKKKVLINGENADFYFEVEGRRFAISDIKAVWYRKGVNWLNDEFFKIEIEDHKRLSDVLSRSMNKERRKLGEFINYAITSCTPVLGSATNTDLNKLIVLEKARKAGLNVPDFAISNSKQWLIDFLAKSKDGIISKSMSDGLYLFDSKYTQKGYFTYTEELSSSDLDALSEEFVPSFVQQKVDKAYEIRSFFMEGDFYTMAILSQSDESTKVDFRKYNGVKPNRFIPYKLPQIIKNQLTQLFGSLELNTGSIDLLVDTADNFYFLEINPVGQFGMVSLPCNYFLEKQVALNLIEKCQTN